MQLILDRQHGDKGRGWTPGATYDLDRDGSPDLVEALLTPVYLRAAQAAIEDSGHSALYIDSGPYSQRHRLAVEAAKQVQPTAYYAAHFNAGGGDYGAIFYDYRSTAGRLLAGCVEDELRIACPELTSVRSIAAHPEKWTANAWHTISGLWAAPSWACGVCLEPAFIDNPAHHPLLQTEGLNRIGAAIAKGALKWAAIRQA